MKLLIFLFCALLEWSVAIPAKDRSLDTFESLHSNEIFFQLSPQSQSSDAIQHHETKLTTAQNRDYIFLGDDSGKVIIIDAATHKIVISYSLPEISYSVSAIVNDTFYNIDTVNGTIFSTGIGNILKSPENIIWDLVGAFPSDTTPRNYIRCSSAVNDSLIYFVTFPGNLYYYDTTSKITFIIGNIEPKTTYASLVVVGNDLFIHKYHYFYSFNGTSVTSIPTPVQDKYDAGLFQQGSDVCLIGTLASDPNANLVYCYDPINEQWSTPSRINFARRNSGVVSTGLKTYIFGGFNDTSRLWFNSVEVLNHETNLWGFIPTPLIQGQKYVQALAFNF